MKLATIRDGTRDGSLAVVSRDLRLATRAEDVVAGLSTLQALLDDWDELSPKVERIAAELNEAAEGGRHAPFATFAFDPDKAMAPLPRAYQWADGSAYVNHVELVRRARGADMPSSFWRDPLMYQGGSDSLTGAREDIVVADAAFGIDLEGEIAVVTGDVPMGVAADEAAGHIRLLMLANDVSLRNLIPGELAKGFGFFHGKPSTAFAPVAVTPDELGPAWRACKVHLALHTSINGTGLGAPNAGHDMTFSFADLIVHAAKTRRLSAGTIVGSGTVSNKGADGGPGLPMSEGGAGYTCLAEVRTVETIRHGKPLTPFLSFGDRVRLEILDANGASVFGAIDQKVVRYESV